MKGNSGRFRSQFAEIFWAGLFRPEKEARERPKKLGELSALQEPARLLKKAALVYIVRAFYGAKADGGKL
jgi:hypothetical protein